MTLEAVYYVSQIIAVVVIVATLIAILWQGYQTNKIARADLTLSMWMASGAMTLSMVDTEDKAAFMHRVLDPAAMLTPTDKNRLAFVMYTAIGIFEAAYNLRQRGLIEDAAYERSAMGIRNYFHSTVARKWWRRHRKEAFDAGLCTILDKMVAEAESSVEPPAPGQGTST